MKDLILVSVLVCIVLFPLQVAAESSADVPGAAHSGAEQSTAVPTCAGAEPQAIIAGTCTAYCPDTGGSVSVSCSGTCTVIDQDCDSGVRGYVQCNNNPPKYCGQCIPCFAETMCPEGGSVYCSGWGEDNCMGGMGLCFVRCNGVYTFCPGHVGEIICF